MEFWDGAPPPPQPKPEDDPNTQKIGQLVVKKTSLPSHGTIYKISEQSHPDCIILYGATKNLDKLLSYACHHVCALVNGEYDPAARPIKSAIAQIAALGVDQRAHDPREFLVPIGEDRIVMIVDIGEDPYFRICGKNYTPDKIPYLLAMVANDPDVFAKTVFRKSDFKRKKDNGDTEYPGPL